MANESRCFERYKSCVARSDSFTAPLLSGKPLNAVFVCGDSSYDAFRIFTFMIKRERNVPTVLINFSSTLFYHTKD
jgi:hypothetical protein